MSDSIPTDSENAYGLWHPKVDGRRNAREEAAQWTTATAEHLAELSTKITAGKVEAQRMLESGHICERAIGAYHAAFYAELDACMTRAAIRRVQAAIAESEHDADKRKHHFGYFETSAGDM